MAESTHAQRMNSNRLIEEYFDSFLIRYRFIGNIEPSTEYSLFGEKFSTPILSSPLAMFHKLHESGILGYGAAIKAAGSAFFTGWVEDDELKAMTDSGIRVSRGIKPFADHDKIYRCIEAAEKCGAFAVNMDIDHIFDFDGKYCRWVQGPLGSQTVEDLKGYAASTKLPFVLKGVLTAEDAEKCVEAGAGAIIVSTHNNRFPRAVPPLAALPEIKKVVNGRFPVLVDGGIQSGVEAFIALALGADGVLACRAFMEAFSRGPEAVTGKLNQMTQELAGCMANTGAATIAQISADQILRKTW